MSSMAAEIAARMAEDGINPQGPGDQVPMVDVPPVETPGSPGGREAAVPGNEGVVPPAPVVPPAGAPNTETPPVAGDPGPIPYPRFKEVNDRLKEIQDKVSGYEYLENYGYDPDSLGQLAAFEARYRTDPLGTMTSLVDQLDLPSEHKERIKESLGAASSSPGDGGVVPPPAVQSDGLSPEDRELLQWARERREREQQTEVETRQNAQLASVVNHWTVKDKEDNVRTPPEHRILTFVSAAAASGRYRTVEELAEAARADYLAERNEILGNAVQPSRGTEPPPPALPGTVAATPGQRPRSLGDANKLVAAALERGESLGSITGG